MSKAEFLKHLEKMLPSGEYSLSEIDIRTDEMEFVRADGTPIDNCYASNAQLEIYGRFSIGE